MIFLCKKIKQYKSILVLSVLLCLTSTSFGQNENITFDDKNYIAKYKTNKKLIRLYKKGKKISQIGLEWQKSSIKQFNKCIKIESNFIPAYFERGKALKKIQKFDMAINDFSFILTKESSITQVLVLRLLTRIDKFTPKYETYLTPPPPNSVYKVPKLSIKDAELICSDLQQIKKLKYTISKMNKLLNTYCKK